MCPECNPLQKTVKSNTETARCYTPSFPYQCHFDGYIEMLEEVATLFWEGSPDPDPNPWSENKDPAPHSEEVLPLEELSLKR